MSPARWQLEHPKPSTPPHCCVKSQSAPHSWDCTGCGGNDTDRSPPDHLSDPSTDLDPRNASQLKFQKNSYFLEKILIFRFWQSTIFLWKPILLKENLPHCNTFVVPYSPRIVQNIIALHWDPLSLLEVLYVWFFKEHTEKCFDSKITIIFKSLQSGLYLRKCSSCFLVAQS